MLTFVDYTGGGQSLRPWLPRPSGGKKTSAISSRAYRGRIAPSPTGYLHLGHARTFLIAAERASNAGGALVFRNEDLDRERCRPEFVAGMLEDLRWLGVHWNEGPDCGGAYGPYSQSERQNYYLKAWQQLRERGLIYSCSCSRRDLARAISAPNDSDDEPIYPGTCRDKIATLSNTPSGLNWRFRVPEGETVTFSDGNQREQHYTGLDFGDFLVWRKDDIPAYQLAVVVDDHAMRISEVCARARPPEVHGTATATLSRARVRLPRVLPLRSSVRRSRSSPGQTP